MVSESASKSNANLSPSPGPSQLSASTSISAPPSTMDHGRGSEEGDSDQHDERSARSTPTRITTELTRSQSAGKGGCW